jgi:hypothetical protein
VRDSRGELLRRPLKLDIGYAVLFGSSDDCAFMSLDPTMPARALCLERSNDGTVWAEALAPGELRLNGQPLEGRAALEVGDELKLREATFVVR